MRIWYDDHEGLGIYCRISDDTYSATLLDQQRKWVIASDLRSMSSSMITHTNYMHSKVRNAASTKPMLLVNDLVIFFGDGH